jgi:glutamate-ammonia-ligase adenylyltransferase
MSIEQLTDLELIALGIGDPERARRILTGLAGQGVTDDLLDELLPSLLDALRASPDPDRALTNFARWTDSVTSRYTHIQYLLGHPAALSIFFNVCGVSQLFSDILIRNPEYFEILANPGVRGGGKSAAALYRELSGFIDRIIRPELKLEAMRRFKQREILRIGTRDILELADMPTTAREFSNLADSCVQKCYEIAVAQLAEKYAGLTAGEPGGKLACPISFIVIGMGKLGGQELNYSSDIDLMFVAGDDALPELFAPYAARLSPLEYAHKLAESIVGSLSQNLQNGHLFRVDMRLRPEGRFGALVRTLSSYQAYYESWAEPWERQSLVKSRVIAGDTRLGEAFSEAVTRYVYRRSVTSDFVESIRHNKRRMEQKAELEGKTNTNVKVGFGGIRDIEFSVQLLQLELGGRDPLLRTPNTLEALARLRQAGVVTEREASELSEDYQFLRTVEHRLQILYDAQTQSLPVEPNERRLLARRLGYHDTAEFDADYQRRTERVHAHFERLFYGSRQKEDLSGADIWRSLLTNIETPQARTALLYAFEAEGFHDPERAYSIFKGAIAGGDYGQIQPEARELFLDLAGRLVAATTRTGDPDTALRGIEALAQATPNPAPFFRALLEGDEVLDRLCRLGSGSPPMVQTLARHMEWLDLLVSEEILDPAPKQIEQAEEELYERLSGAKNEEEFWDGLALYIQRERLRIAARDLWGEVNAGIVARELSVLAEAVLSALLARFIENEKAKHPSDTVRDALESMAVIGLGKLGGGELGYGSDWDILIAYERSSEEGEARSEAYTAVISVVEALLSSAPQLRVRGAPVEIDARLRPEGKKGALAYTPAEYRDYYLNSSLTWERQVLTKARFVAGNADTASKYAEGTYEVIYSRTLSPEESVEIQAMKRRMESERLKSGDQLTDIKLGHGGMSDIEFLVQMLQMRSGAAHAAARNLNTVAALYALGAAGILPVPDAARLADTYLHWTAVRNRLWLLGGLSNDILPSDARRLRAVAVGLGEADTPLETAEAAFRRKFDERMRETRAIVERLFYGSQFL